MALPGVGNDPPEIGEFDVVELTVQIDDMTSRGMPK